MLTNYFERDTAGGILHVRFEEVRERGVILDSYTELGKYAGEVLKKRCKKWKAKRKHGREIGSEGRLE